MSKHDIPEYGVWAAMKRRCNNPNVKDYPNYGGRGIKVCDRWNDFDAFYADMGSRPEGGMIERINNDGNYEPGNVRWATRADQANNKRNSRLMSCNGKTQTVAQWCHELGLSVGAIHQRLKNGWSEERALSVTSQAESLKKLGMDAALQIRAEYPAKSIGQLAKEYGVDWRSIRNVVEGRTYTASA